MNWLRGVSREPTRIVDFLVALNQRLEQDIEYVVRMEPGVQTCEETLTKGSGSCRDTGWLLAAELDALARALDNPARPFVAIVGGSKVSTKLTVLEALMDKVDELIVGGGIANTFIAATGHKVGQSLYEPDLIPDAQRLIKKAHERGGSIPIPRDVLVAKAFEAKAPAYTRKVDEVNDDEMILDIGPLTAMEYSDIISGMGTIIWNGPVGVFEFRNFGGGTLALAEAIARSSAYSIAGGGDTLAAIDQFDVREDISYISTGGGAFLEFVEGKKLPAVAALEAAARG